MHQDLREEIVWVARQTISSNLVTGTSGSVSARTPGGDILITPSGLACRSPQRDEPGKGL